jgi:hypothetical protein
MNSIVNAASFALEGNLLSIAGPIWVAGFIRHIEVRQLPHLASVGVHDEDVELASTFAVGSERNLGPIRRPRGVAIVGRVICESQLLEARAVSVHHVNLMPPLEVLREKRELLQ